MTTFYIDVSQHDWSRRGGALDWDAIRAAGLGTVMCARASYGDPQVFNPPSPRFAADMAAARAAGFTTRGAYHNLIRGDQASINRQVDLLRSTMDRYGGEWAMADVEAYGELVTQGLVPRWEDVQRFHDRWYQVEPNTVMAWYIAQWVWVGKLGAPNLTGLRGPLINAHYRGGDGTAQQIYAAAGGAGWPGWSEYVTVINGVTRRSGRGADIGQYSSSGNVPGASSNTDCNAYRGELAALVALLTGGTVPSGGTDDMATINQDDWEALIRRVEAEYYDLDAVRGGPHLGKPEGVNKAKAARVELRALLEAIASRVDIDPAELEQIKQASAEGTAAAIPALADAILAKLPADTMTRADVEAAVRDAFAGGLAPDAAP